MHTLLFIVGPCVMENSVGRYQYFTSGIRYYKFKTVSSGISQYFDQAQLTSYSQHFLLTMCLVSKHSRQYNM